MPYYKFVAAGRINDLLAGLIRFTQPGAFNDPFEIPAMKLAEIEARPDDFLSAALDQTRDIQASFAANPFLVPAAAMVPVVAYWYGGDKPADAASLSVEERERRLNEGKQRIKEIDRTFGILSLSQDGRHVPARENFLLWAHYADEHRGAAVEIDIDDSDFTAGYEGKGGAERRGPVRYVRDRPRLPLDDEILQEHFYNKSPHWEYETEFRIVRDLVHHDEVKGKRSRYPVYLFRLPASCLRSITLGARFNETEREELVQRLKDDDLRHVALAQTRLDPQRFNFTFEDVTIRN